MDLAFLIAPLAIASLSAAFAALVSVTDRIVNNYGEVVIDVNNGSKKLDVTGGANMLVTLAESQIFIPSACGGRGSCGECKVKVNSDIGPHLPTEIPYLTREQIDDNVRLSCQVKIKGDVDIQIPEYLFKIKQYTGTVERIRDVTHDIKEVYFKLDEGQTVDFRAGQYGQIETPPYAKVKERTQRAYSMSSKPSDSNHVEFLVRLVPGGIVTTYVHEHLKEGEKMKIIAPFGEFYVRDTDATMICVAGGSGMAPFKSIFYDFIEKDKMAERDIWYFFGARTRKDLFYLDEMQKIQDEHERFHFVAALSEPQPEDDWQGETGLITDVLDKYLKSKIPTDAPKEGYLCGSPGMLDACMDVMRSNDMSDDKIYFDKFA
ncbi:MAG: oxidoreductase [Spirochaetaceae bacterium]|nr:MAG: oxidoreductase [Spirochaetaceae bacterium]